MSQAEDLLNAMAVEAASSHSHSVRDPDKHFVIDPETRQMSNMSGVRNVIMQYDHNSEVYTFELPRYVEGHDMTKCNRVRLHYINIGRGTRNRYADVVEMTDLAVNPSDSTTVISTWTIRREATQLAGTLNFLVQYMCVDGAGEVVYEWHTDIYTEVDIKTGMNNSEQAVIEYSNILEDWYQRLFGLEDSLVASIVDVSEKQKTAIGLKGAETLASIPEDYTDTASMAEDAIRKKANAIEMRVSGESIFVNDSSDAYVLGLNLYGKTTQFTTTGKNLLPHFTISDPLAILVINDDGSITITNKATSETSGASVVLTGLLEAGTYRFTNLNGTPQAYIMRAAGDYSNPVNIGTGKTFEYDGTSYLKIIYANIPASSVVTFKAMVERGSETTEYEPYSGGVSSPSPEWSQGLHSVKNPNVSILGKNLLGIDTDGKNNNGITYTVNADGGVTCVGTATDTSLCNLLTIYELPKQLIAGRKYIASGASSNISIQVYDWQNKWVHRLSTSDEAVFTIGENATGLLFRLVINSGLTINETVYPMIRMVDIDDPEYESYKNIQTIELPYVLSGIPVDSGGNYTDNSGQQWICDEVDFERGVYIQRVGTKVFDGTEDTWRLHGTLNTFMVDWPNFDGGWQLNHAMATHFVCDTKAYSNEIGYFAFDNKGLGYFATGHSTIEEFRAWMNTNPVTVVCKLLSPTEIPLTDEEIAYYKQLKTNYPNTTVLNDADAHMSVVYNADTRMYIDNHSVSEDSVQAAVDAYLDSHFTDAEEVSF